MIISHIFITYHDDYITNRWYNIYKEGDNMSKTKKNKETIFYRKDHQTLAEFADMLELIASKLREEKEFVLQEEDKETTISPNDDVETKLSYKTKDSKHKFKIEFEWREDQSKTFQIK